MAPYDRYRRVGKRWLREVPASWDVTRLKYLCSVSTGSGDTINAKPSGAYPFYVRSDVPRRADAWDFDCEAVLTAGDGAVGEVFNRATGKFLAHQRVYVLHDFHGIDIDFFYYYFSALFKRMAGDGSAKTTVDSVRRWMLTDMPVAVPPKADQREIAAFLDREIAQIERLIAEQERLIELLTERRNAVVQQLVWTGTSACDTSSALIEYAPPSPSHWLRLRNKNLLRETRELSETGDEELLSVSHLSGVTPRSQKKITMIAAADHRGYKKVRPGDLAVNTMWAWMGALGVSRTDGIISPSYASYRPSDERLFVPDYFDLLYRTASYVHEMARHSKGIRASRLRLYPEEFLALPVVVPTREEQLEIVEAVRQQTRALDELISEALNLIELSHERRSALTTAVVTGQLRVTAAA